jgi:CHAT domain
VAAANRADLDATLRDEAAAAWAAIEPQAVDEALAQLPRAWTLGDFALRVLADVNVIDEAVFGCRETIWYASREARFLFPPAPQLLDGLACAAHSHVSRFEYRLDLGDLDEATFLAEQVLTLGQETRLDVSTWARAAAALAWADLWRYRVLGDPDFVDAAIDHIEEPANTGDPGMQALLAECLQARALTLDPDDALTDLERARAILDRLLDPEYQIPNLKVLPWLEAGWGATWCLVELTAYQITGEEECLSRAVHLGRTAIIHVLPSTAEAEAAHLAALLTWITADGVTRKSEEIAAEQVEIAIAAGTGRYWYALQSALTHAEWGLSHGWSQPGTTSARIAYDIVDQTLDHQSGEEYRRPWVPWLALTTALAVPALAAADAPGPAASRLEQARTRILAERFYDDISELAALPLDLRDEVADPLAHNLRVLRDPTVSRITRATARDDVLRATAKVRQRPGFEFFRWKLEPDELLRTLGDCPTVYLTPGEPHGVAILGGGSLGDWRSVPLPRCESQPKPVAAFLERTMSGSEPTGRRRQAVDPVTGWLGEAVWRPIADLLSGVDELWLVPCGYLGLLPCHAGRLDTSGVDFALRRWDIRYAITARSLSRARELPVPARAPTFVGIPQPASQEGLKGARGELAAVAKHFAGSRVLDAHGVTPRAALEAVRRAGYLHAACHGTADPNEPLMSGLELGAEERLTLHDLSNIRTALELGVLSACETNVPDLSSPDEAMSLAVGLHLTGCRAVIASSWQVPDDATSALMNGFYQRWRGPQRLPVTEALRRAQLDLADSERWHEPYYWAGFSFLGAPPTGN